MNKVNVISDTSDFSQSKSMLDHALDLMKETTGDRSPEVATVLQSMGNLAKSHEDFNDALTLHLKAHTLRRENFGPDHRDVGVSLGNIASTLGHMAYFHNAMRLWERSLEILTSTLGEEHHLSQNALKGLEQCKNFAVQAVKSESGFGVVLLVFNALPLTEYPPDPTTPEGATVVAKGIRDTLIGVWDDSLAHGSFIPILVISCPGYEHARYLVSKEEIIERFPEELLTWLEIPVVSGDCKSQTAWMPLYSIEQKFLGWLQEHKLDVLMVKPITASGATLDRRLLELVRRSFRGRSQSHPEISSKNSGNAKQDLRPIAIEIVPFDQLDGPLLGLYTGDNNPRPSVMPASNWRQQKYTPQAADLRATGVFYMHLEAIRQWLASCPASGLTPLEEWSMRPLMSMATGSLQDQLRVFESALSELVLLVKTRPVNCPAERGARGFHLNRTYREIEDLLN
jgi:hypothetical protein